MNNHYIGSPTANLVLRLDVTMGSMTDHRMALSGILVESHPVVDEQGTGSFPFFFMMTRFGIAVFICFSFFLQFPLQHLRLQMSSTMGISHATRNFLSAEYNSQ